jgi:hypothetical protein
VKHILEQPLHQTLKQYRILAIVSVAFIGWLMTDLVGWYKGVAHTLSPEATAGLFAFLAALLGAFVKALNNVKEKHE